MRDRPSLSSVGLAHSAARDTFGERDGSSTLLLSQPGPCQFSVKRI
jgi:hypothetical protein